MILLGLTGGIGCGKSTAARMFTDHGFRSVDTDALVHSLLARDKEVKRRIAERFGGEMLDLDGAVDRRRLGARVFADREALDWLERLLHPKVGELWRNAVAGESDRDWVVQIPLLFEKKLEESFHFTVCVGASGETQQNRLVQRGLSKEEITRRISRQMPVEDKVARSDFFLSNDGSLHFLRLQVAFLCRRLREMPLPSLS